MLIEVLKVLSVLGFSATKFMVGAGLSFSYSYGFLQSILLLVSGGMIGVFVFVYFSEMIYSFVNKGSKPQELPKTRINRRRRALVKIRKKSGLLGIAVLTPVFLTVPVGTFLAMSITKDKMELCVYMFLSFLFWSILFSGSFYFLNINVQDLFEKVIFWA